MSKKAILIGATGLIGRDLLNLLLADDRCEEVLVISRKALSIDDPKLKKLVINFDDLAIHAAEIRGEVVFCCLGTTAKKTPDLIQYKKIDYQFPLDVAKIAFANGAKQYHLVSAMGANVNSSIFYSRTKGEVERDLAKIGFEALHIYRPSLLVGTRKEHRAGEKMMTSLMRIINPLLIGPLKKYRSITIDKVSDAMVTKTSSLDRGVYIYNSEEIVEIARY